MAYCYFKCPFFDGPEELHEVDVELLHKTIVDFKEDSKVALWGGSRGAELATVLATYLERNPLLVSADLYIADRPAHIVVPAYFSYYDDSSNWKNGQPWVQPIKDNWIGTKEGPHILKKGWVWGIDANAFTPYEPIEIEHYTGPYLAIHGAEDKIWPMQFSMILENRLVKSGNSVESFTYDENETQSSVNSTNAQFHYFKGTGHSFASEWSQMLRAEVIKDFLNQHF